MPGPFRNRGIAGLVPVAVSIVSTPPPTVASGVYYAVFTAHDGMGILRYRTVRELVAIR